jgi:peptidoglycan-associated lipoprotein
MYLMSRPRTRHVALYPAAAFGLAVLAAGCGHHNPPAAAPAPAPVAAAPAPAQPTPVTPVVDEGAGKRALAALRNTLTQMMFFDFDRAELTSEDRATLDAKIPILQANAGLRIRVDGNCDDRGSDEYNMALGQRRAAAAKRYLTDHGIDASRIEIVSYGREHPLAQGNDEASWAKNRNDQFEIVAGADQMHAGQ